MKNNEKSLRSHEFADILGMAMLEEPLCPEEAAARDAYIQSGGFDGDPERAELLARRAQEIMPEWLIRLKDSPNDKILLFRPRD